MPPHSAWRTSRCQCKGCLEGAASRGCPVASTTLSLHRRCCCATRRHMHGSGVAASSATPPLPLCHCPSARPTWRTQALQAYKAGSPPQRWVGRAHAGGPRLPAAPAVLAPAVLVKWPSLRCFCPCVGKAKRHAAAGMHPPSAQVIGIWPEHSLLNHSCVPSTVSYVVK